MSLSASAEVIDHVDVIERDNEADIIIQFSQKIIYLRHASTQDELSVRVFIRLRDPNVHESDLAQEVVKSPKSSRFPAATIIYPELINGMLVTFKKPTKVNVQPGSDGQSIILTIPLAPLPKLPAPVSAEKKLPLENRIESPVAAKKVEPQPSSKQVEPQAKTSNLPVEVTKNESSAVPQVSEEMEKKAKEFLGEAQNALSTKDMAKGINRLNRILGLPTNANTELAQAMIGQAREANGEILKAKAEYELYLKLFPDGPNAALVKSRLEKLPKNEAAIRATPKALPKEAGEAEWTYNGSISAYYYTGKSQIETLTPPPPGQLSFNRDTLSLVDQNSLISSVNFNARRRDAFMDTRLVIRDTNNHNFLTPNRSYNRLYTAYIDHTDRQAGYYVRAGRQNPNGMGVLDRYDGVQAGYNLTPQFKFNGIYGNAVEFGSPFRKIFYGASVDYLPQTGIPGVSIYGIQQDLDGYANRRAIGTEVRYFDGKATAYGTVDYDVLNKGVNIALLQGNYITEDRSNYFFVADHRRAPSFSLTNSLQAAPGISLRDMIISQGLKNVRAQASSLTATSDMLAIGVTHPFSEMWQLGIDYRLASISSTLPVSAVLPLAVIGTCLGRIDTLNNTCIIDTSSQQGSGINHVVTLQAIGTNLLAPNAVGVANVSLIKAPTYNGQASSLGYAIPLWDQLRIDTNLRYYTQKDTSDNKQDRLSFSFKLAYQWRNSMFFEGEAGREMSNTSGLTRNDHSVRDYVFFGVRGDFR